MALKLYKIISVILILFIFISDIYAGSKKDYILIKNSFNKNHNYSRLKIKSRKYFRKYPRSRYIPDLKLLLAVNNKTPKVIIKRLNKIIRTYKYYKKNDYIILKICEISFLLSKWKDLKKYSYSGIKKYKKSKYLNDFKIFHINSLIKLRRYKTAEKEAYNFIKSNHEYKYLSKALISLAYIIKVESGLSRKYIFHLRELAQGFKNSDIYPALLYLLGKFYEKNSDYDRAYSAYTDLKNKFPRSPEYLYAKKNLLKLAKYNPKRIEYIPNKKILNNTDKFDISPTREIDEITDIKYSLSIGPFKSKKKVLKLKKIISDYNGIKTLKLKRGYFIFIGSHSTREKAIKMKIRLAEELGINALVIRIKGEGGKIYIYGE